MLDALRSNPALLKLDLYCRASASTSSCYVEADGGRKILRTRAGLGSGLELILPGGLWTNVPVTEQLRRSAPPTPCTGRRPEHGRYLLRWTAPTWRRSDLSPRPRLVRPRAPRAASR